MNFRPICPDCGALMIERRAFSHDGPLLVSVICDCGHAAAFTLNFSNPVHNAPRLPAERRERFVAFFA
jgi:hypothetical protein